MFRGLLMPSTTSRPEAVTNPHDAYVKSVFRELRRALYYLLSVTEDEQEPEVRQALQSIQDEFLPVKEEIMTLLEHLREQGKKQGKKQGQRMGKISTLTRFLSAAFPEFSSADADRLRKLSDEALDQLTDAVAVRRSWDEIEPLLRRSDD